MGDREVPNVSVMRPAQACGLQAIPRQARGSESGGWVLKGAFALELRLGVRTRTTKDIDLARADNEEAATEPNSTNSAATGLAGLGVAAFAVACCAGPAAILGLVGGISLGVVIGGLAGLLVIVAGERQSRWPRALKPQRPGRNRRLRPGVHGLTGASSAAAPSMS
jgi:hypothetical protein